MKKIKKIVLLLLVVLLAGVAYWKLFRVIGGGKALPHDVWIDAAAKPGGDGSRQLPFSAFDEIFKGGKRLEPGSVIHVCASTPLPFLGMMGGPCGTDQNPITIRGEGTGRASVRGMVQFSYAKHVVLERLAFDDVDGLMILGSVGVEVRDCEIAGGTLDLEGSGNAVTGGRIAAASEAGIGIVGSGAVVSGVTIESCGAGIVLRGDATVKNCLFLHNRGPAVSFKDATEPKSLKFHNNLLYDNSGGIVADKTDNVEIVNNIFVNNYATTLLSEDDVEVAVGPNAVVNHNVYFRHPGKDKLLRGLPYGQGVDLAPLRPDNPFGLRLRVDKKVVFSLKDPAWAKFDKDSQSLDIVQRFVGPNEYTRNYEDLFADFQKEDFHPRYTSPCVGRGDSLPAVTTDIEGKPRLAEHPDIGPYAAPAEWWKDIDSGQATIVDGRTPLDANGRDVGLGTAAKPFSTLAKAAAFARWNAKIYIHDSIYRDTAMQTSFWMGPEGKITGWPGERPAFSPSECLAPARWEKYDSAGTADSRVWRVRDWHTFLGGNWRFNSWMQDWYGNLHIGGKDENVTSFSREPREAGPAVPPDRPRVPGPRHVAAPVGRDRAGARRRSRGTGGFRHRHVRGVGPRRLPPPPRIVHGRAAGFPAVQDGRRGRTQGGAVLPRRAQQASGDDPPRERQGCRSRVAIPGGNDGDLAGGVHLSKRRPHLVAGRGDDRQARQERDPHAGRRMEEGPLGQGLGLVGADFALPVAAIRAGGHDLARQQAQIDRAAMPLGSWRQRQNQWGDAEIAAVVDNPYQDCLEVRLGTNEDPNKEGVEATYFNARVEGLWRGTLDGNGPAVNKAGAIMLSQFRTMEPCATAEVTAQTARETWDFGFFIPMGQTAPVLEMRMPAVEDDKAAPSGKKAVDPNTEDFWRLAVVDDCLYVFPPLGEAPQQHVVDAACEGGMYMYGASGNSGFFDWHDGGSIKGAPAAKIFATELDFDSDDHDPLWLPGHVSIPTQGFQLDVSDPTGRTIHLLDDVRLDASGPGEKLLTFTYLDGSAASPVRHEVKISSKDLKPDRRVVLPTPPTGFPDRGAFTIAPATAPQQAVEQSPWIAAKVVASPSDMAPGCCWYDPSKHQFYVCPPAGNLEFVGAWSGCRYGPVEHLRGLYLLGGNSYGHQKQYGWGSGLTVPSRLIEDVTVGFSTTGVLSSVPGTEARDCQFRWAQCEIGRGGELSGDVRHTADRIKRPELRVKHCVFDVANSFLFDGNDNPTKNIPFANHHIWEDNYFMSIMSGLQACWWDQYGFNNVVQNNLFTGCGGVDIECCENLMARNNIFANDKRSAVTYRGSDHGYVINNTSFRGGGLWFDSEPQRANATEQGPPCYGETFPVTRRGQVPWMTIDNLGNEKGISLNVKWLPAPMRPRCTTARTGTSPPPCSSTPADSRITPRSAASRR